MYLDCIATAGARLTIFSGVNHKKKAKIIGFAHISSPVSFGQKDHRLPTPSEKGLFGNSLISAQSTE